MKKLLLLLLLSCCYLQAQAKNYQVEMIIFSHFTTQGKAEEQRSGPDPSQFNFNDAAPIASLPSSQFILRNEQNRLNQHPSYQTLLHIAWRQSVGGIRHARRFRLRGNHVDGTIRVSVQRYLNVALNLLFEQHGDYFYLSQTRRMRSNELNYIDFPLYGVLIKIVPVK